MRIACLVLITTLVTACAQETPPPSPSTFTTAQELASALTAKAREQGGYGFSLTSQAGPASGAVRLTGDQTLIDMTAERVVQSGKPAERLRFVSPDDTRVYVLLPPVFELPAAKPWVQLKRDDTDEFTAGMLSYFDAASQQALFTGHHLTAIATGKLTSSIEREGRTTYTVTVEVTNFAVDVDDKGLPTRIVVSTPTDAGPIVDEASFTWGAAADIVAPKPEEISQRG